MDQELIAYLDQRFNSLERRFDAVEMRLDSQDQRFDSVEMHLDSQDQRFDSVEMHLNSQDQRFDSVEMRLDSQDQRFDSNDQRFLSIDQRFDRVEEAIRHTNITVEALRDDIRLLAEAVDINDKKTERRFQAFSMELKQEIALVTRSCSDLNRRVTKLEKAS